MNRAKGATPAEIMGVTECQAHTVRDFVSILRSKERLKIESDRGMSEAICDTA